MSVAPRAGAWIEIGDQYTILVGIRSHPVRVRGLKSITYPDATDRTAVAPRAGAWIEILYDPKRHPKLAVAPRAGAWIEIQHCTK